MFCFVLFFLSNFVFLSCGCFSYFTVLSLILGDISVWLVMPFPHYATAVIVLFLQLCFHNSDSNSMDPLCLFSLSAYFNVSFWSFSPSSLLNSKPPAFHPGFLITLGFAPDHSLSVKYCTVCWCSSFAAG